MVQMSNFYLRVSSKHVGAFRCLQTKGLRPYKPRAFGPWCSKDNNIKPMRISTEILVSAYGLFWAKPPRFAPASLAAGARGSTLLPPPSSVRPMQLHVCSSYASLCYAASLPQPGDRNTAAKRGREDSRHGGALVLRRTTWRNPARLGVRARLKLLFDLFSGSIKHPQPAVSRYPRSSQDTKVEPKHPRGKHPSKT